MKRYVRPMMDAQMFVANEYVAACWEINCNVPSGYGYFEKNGIPGYQRNGDEKVVSGHGCGTKHYASGIDAAGPSANAMWQETNAYGEEKGEPYPVFYFKARNTSSEWWEPGSNHHFCTLDAVNWNEKPNASN